MYKIILLGSLPGFLMAIAMFAEYFGFYSSIMALLLVAFVVGQTVAWWLCRHYNM